MLWLLGSLCQIARVPFDPALVSQEFPPPITTVTLHEAARALGFRTGERSVTAAVLPGLTFSSGITPTSRALASTETPARFPCIAFQRAAPAAAPAPATPTQLHVVREGEQTEFPEPPCARPALILRADANQFLFISAGSDQPETLPLAEFDLYFEPTLILVAKDASLSPAGRGIEGEGETTAPPKFGFRWFLPELLRHKRIWRDVLLASLSIQLAGLATPVFTQVIIDKVVVHQTQSTLIVIAVALVMFMLFTAVMTWLRQYLVLHTGNRIDAVLVGTGTPGPRSVCKHGGRAGGGRELREVQETMKA